MQDFNVIFKNTYLKKIIADMTPYCTSMRLIVFLFFPSSHFDPMEPDV